MSNPDVTFVRSFDGLDEKVICQLIHEALPAFYKIFGLTGEPLAEGMRSQLHQLSEVNQVVIALRDKEIAGLICYFSSAELKSRQMASAFDLLKLAPERVKSAANLREFTRLIPPMDVPGFYLSRVSVSAAFRGTRLAHDLLAELEKIIRSEHESRVLLLHVSPENHRAIRFYEKQGFQRIPCLQPDTGSYIVMKKEL